MVAMEARRCTLLLAGLMLLTRPTTQLEVFSVPSMTPYPVLGPMDSGYPANIPAGLPVKLEAPPVLVQGPVAACPTTVAAVLAANQRTLLSQYLAATPEGQQILSGSRQATILAPTDGALKYVLANQNNGLSGPEAASTVAQYHVLQGKRSMADLTKTSGLWFNTTLTAAVCPTAYQTVTILSAGTTTYARSATQTAQITTGDLAACNSVVHLMGSALQPCCVSLFNELEKFSIVKIQPSYFEGYAQQEPIQNTDGFNRRAFEEALVDFLLYTTDTNQTRTVLWPSQPAWDNLNLASLLPGITLDNTTRIQAMRILALYSISYAQSLLPKDIPGHDGSAPAITFPFQTALRNMTAMATWSCSDTLSVTLPAWSQYAGDSAPNPAPASPSPAPAPGSPAFSPSASSPLSASPQPVPSPSPPAVPSPSPSPNASHVNNELVMTRHLRQLQQQDAIGGARRKLQAAATGNSKTVRVLDVLETCEGIRVLFVDAVPVPCGFASLVKDYSNIRQAFDTTYSPRQYKTLGAALYDWLVQKGYMPQGQKVSEYRNGADCQPCLECGQECC